MLVAPDGFVCNPVKIPQHPHSSAIMSMNKIQHHVKVYPAYRATTGSPGRIFCTYAGKIIG